LPFEKFIITWDDEEMPLHVTEEFITHHWSLSWTRQIQSAPCTVLPYEPF